MLFLLHTHHAAGKELFPTGDHKKTPIHSQKSNSVGLLRATYSNYFLLKKTHQQSEEKQELVERDLSGSVLCIPIGTGNNNVLSPLQVATNSSVYSREFWGGSGHLLLKMTAL